MGIKELLIHACCILDDNYHSTHVIYPYLWRVNVRQCMKKFIFESYIVRSLKVNPTSTHSNLKQVI